MKWISLRNILIGSVVVWEPTVNQKNGTNKTVLNFPVHRTKQQAVMISAYFLLAATVYTVTSAASISSNDGKNRLLQLYFLIL